MISPAAAESATAVPVDRRPGATVWSRGARRARERRADVRRDVGRARHGPRRRPGKGPGAPGVDRRCTNSGVTEPETAPESTRTARRSRRSSVRLAIFALVVIGIVRVQRLRHAAHDAQATRGRPGRRRPERRAAAPGLLPTSRSTPAAPSRAPRPMLLPANAIRWPSTASASSTTSPASGSTATAPSATVKYHFDKTQGQPVGVDDDASSARTGRGRCARPAPPRYGRLAIVSYAGDITPEEAWKLLSDNPDAVLVDCRTEAEWRFVGVPDSRFPAARRRVRRVEPHRRQAQRRVRRRT